MMLKDSPFEKFTNDLTDQAIASYERNVRTFFEREDVELFEREECENFFLRR